eukprot:29881-Pelagococcus_subviridis.AAC.1
MGIIPGPSIPPPAAVAFAAPSPSSYAESSSTGASRVLKSYEFAAVAFKFSAVIAPLVSSYTSVDKSGETSLCDITPLIVPPTVICVSLHGPPSVDADEPPPPPPPPPPRSSKTYSYSPDASDIAMMRTLSRASVFRTNCACLYRTAPSLDVTFSTRVPSSGCSGA